MDTNYYCPTSDLIEAAVPVFDTIHRVKCLTLRNLPCREILFTLNDELVTLFNAAAHSEGDARICKAIQNTIQLYKSDAIPVDNDGLDHKQSIVALEYLDQALQVYLTVHPRLNFAPVVSFDTVQTDWVQVDEEVAYGLKFFHGSTYLVSDILISLRVDFAIHRLSPSIMSELKMTADDFLGMLIAIYDLGWIGEETCQAYKFHWNSEAALLSTYVPTPDYLPTGY